MAATWRRRDSSTRGLELLRILGHHALALLQGETHGIVATGPRIVERGLVGTEIDLDILLSQALPEIDDIADVGH